MRARRLLVPTLLLLLHSGTAPAVAQPGLAASEVAAGGRHSCAITPASGAVCWGLNEQGQLGDGTTMSRSGPVPVAGLSAGVIALAAGHYHTCALTSGGGVWCWGENGSGQLGDGTTTRRSTPVAVSGLTSGVTAISAGGFHSCARKGDASVVCWGDNSVGQLGDGTTDPRSTPTGVVGLTSGVNAVEAGAYHSCALQDGGAVVCWGFNQNGQLGDGTQLDSAMPVPVSGLGSGVAVLSAGSGDGDWGHTCALTVQGAMLCWGYNHYGQLGDASRVDRSVPVPVSGLASGVAAISAGAGHTCAIVANGIALCWGSNFLGQLGDASTTDRDQPVAVTGLPDGVVRLSAGGDQTCAIAPDASVSCWGADDQGQLGNGTAAVRAVPGPVSGLESGVAALSAGGNTCALMGDGGVWCWGSDRFGQLGTGQWSSDGSVPNPVLGLESGVAAIASGGAHTCAVTTVGAVRCWGRNFDGQIGDGASGNGADALAPVPVVGFDSGGATAVSAGDFHSCALTNAGGVQCWGRNWFGEIGDGTTDDRLTPVPVAGLALGVAAISAGGSHTCAVTDEGAARCWGRNDFGQLGDGTLVDSAVPVEVSGLRSGVAAIATGENHSCALRTNGAISCWGANYAGQLGDGSTADSLVPVLVAGFPDGAKAISSGHSHNCAVSIQGHAKCWGDNLHAQLGDGTLESRGAPVVVALPGPVAAVSAGGEHSCALTLAGGVQCWGSNDGSQLGDGYHAANPEPVTVVPEPPATLALPVALAALYGLGRRRRVA